MTTHELWKAGKAKRDTLEELRLDSTWKREESECDLSHYAKDEQAAEYITGLYKMAINNARKEYEKWYHACGVIDEIARAVGLYDKGRYLYGLINGETELLQGLNEALEKGGDKAKLKARMAELERENELLRSLVKGGI